MNTSKVIPMGDTWLHPNSEAYRLWKLGEHKQMRDVIKAAQDAAYKRGEFRKKEDHDSTRHKH